MFTHVFLLLSIARYFVLPYEDGYIYGTFPPPDERIRDVPSEHAVSRKNEESRAEFLRQVRHGCVKRFILLRNNLPYFYPLRNTPRTMFLFLMENIGFSIPISPGSTKSWTMHLFPSCTSYLHISFSKTRGCGYDMERSRLNPAGSVSFLWILCRTTFVPKEYICQFAGAARVPFMMPCHL